MAKVYVFNDNKVIENNETNTKLLIDAINEKVSEINTEKEIIRDRLLSYNIKNTDIISAIVKAVAVSGINIEIPRDLKTHDELIKIRSWDTSNFVDSYLNRIEILEPSDFIKYILKICDDVFSNVQRCADELIKEEKKKGESFEDFSKRVAKIRDNYDF